MDARFFDFEIFAVPDSGHSPDRGRGENARQILVVYELAEPERQAELEAFLGRVLKAAKIDPAKDARLINLTTTERISCSGLQRSLPFRYLVNFGLPPHRLGLNLELPLYRPVLHNGVHLLFCADLSLIHEERQTGGKAHSSALWQALQALFL